MRKMFALFHLILFMALCSQSMAQSMDSNPQPMARVIVKFKDDGNLLRHAAGSERASSMSLRLGFSVAHVHEIAHGHQVIKAANMSSAQLAARLSQWREVEFAEPDERLKISALPNDPMFSSQWYLLNKEAAGANFVSAWDTSTGELGTVVAVIDTGITDHPDLKNKLVPGYNFISDPTLAMNGMGRSNNPSDLGDYIDSSVRNDPAFVSVCGAAELAVDSASSWHGTQVASLIAAQTHNATGMAGAGWGLRVLPLRALGKCGGFGSDIQAAMLWAAGFAVPGVPNNPYPASVLNLSLGGPGACSQSYASIMAQVKTRAVVVAAAGNESGPVDRPANCDGVLAVSGLRHQGEKVGYSSLGKEVGISAPAGNCVNASGPCLYPMISATNSGDKGPVAPAYTDGFNYSVGTSFSAPLVAAAVGLMRDVNPSMSPAETIAKIKVAAKPFPLVTGSPVCSIANAGAPCTCTTALCGTGMLDAGAAVRLAKTNSHAIPESGWWWNAAESGRGYSLEIQGNRLFMAAYMYTADGRAVWYVSAGTMNQDGSFQGDVVEYAGGQTLSGAFKPAQVKGAVTSMQLSCSTPASCTLNWAGRSVAITRFAYDNAAKSASAPQSGWWWNADESGRGFFLEVQGNTVFAAGYMYDLLGNAVWYVASGALANQRLNASWSEYANGQTLTSEYQVAQLKNPAVGSLRLVFSDSQTAVLTLPDGRNVSLTRFVF